MESVAQIRTRASTGAFQIPSEQTLGLLFVTLDLIGFVLIYLGVYWLRFGESANDAEIDTALWLAAFFAINWLSLYLMDLYRVDLALPSIRSPVQSLFAISIATVGIILLSYLSGAVEFSGLIGRGVLIGSQIAFFFFAGSYRGIFHRWLRKMARQSHWLVLSAGDSWSRLQADLFKNGLSGNFFVLTPTQEPLTRPPEVETRRRRFSIDIRHAGTFQQLPHLMNEPWTGCLVAETERLPREMTTLLMSMRLGGTRIVNMVDFYEQIWHKVPVMDLAQSWFALSQGFRLLHYPIGFRVKRVVDIILSSILMIVGFPFLLLGMLLVYFESPGPVIFRQVRVGENGRPFTLMKLRSMGLDAEKDGAQWAQKGDSRVLKTGKFIRASRLDELPQLINVFRGEMSFIGPRPERPEFTSMLEEQIPYYGLRHLVKPGITGWAQVMYPYGSSVDDAREKLQYDLYYIKNYSLGLDLTIVLKTLRVVLFGRGM